MKQILFSFFQDDFYCNHKNDSAKDNKYGLIMFISDVMDYEKSGV